MDEHAGPSRHRLQGWALALSGALGFALVAVLVHRNSKQFSSESFLFCRSVFALVVLGLFLRSEIRSRFCKGAQTEWLVGVFGAVAICMYFVNLQRVPTGLATTLHNLAPILVALMSPLMLKVAVRRRMIAGTIVAAIGVAFLAAAPNAGLDLLGLCLGLGGAALAAVAYVFMKVASRRSSATAIIWVTSLVVLVCSLLLSGVPDATLLSGKWGYALIVSALALGSQMLTVRSYYFLDAVTASVVSLTPVLWTVLYDLSTGEAKFDASLCFGVVAISAGVGLTQWRTRLNIEAEPTRIPVE